MPSAIAYELARLNTEIEQLKAEKARLETENDRLRELLAAKHASLLAGEALAVVPGRCDGLRPGGAVAPRSTAGGTPGAQTTGAPSMSSLVVATPGGTAPPLPADP